MITKILPDEIKTERLVLRRPQKRDTEDFYRYASKKTVGPMAGWQPHHSNRDFPTPKSTRRFGEHPSLEHPTDEDRAHSRQTAIGCRGK